ncbi:tetratricopeptide repeat protein [Fundidesulfovibrio putealis]|uniref:tetratricopeptide repeat protein n=1 Tax=Fundidesulfovibrio putealis TaxID=270496 RepID=UPI000402A069|nr:hypothetical protein [Fundidesulfovibrio putealis]
MRPRHAIQALLRKACQLTLLAALASPSLAATVTREPMPDPARHQALEGTADQAPDAVAPSVQRESVGTDISPPVKTPPKLARGKPAQRQPARDLEALGIGWERLNAGDTPAALASFGQAEASTDKLISQEATLGIGYAYWRQGREAQAEAKFKALIEQGFRIPEVLPNLLYLLYKRGGPKAAEPYLKYLPENERAAWRR